MAPSDNSIAVEDYESQTNQLSNRRILALFVVTMFVGAGLLFWVQPLFAKMVLPLLGGSPAVWNTAMVFFQAALLGGYAYAHWVARALPPDRQVFAHIIVLGFGLLSLPVAVNAGWEPPAEAIPIAWLLGLLAVSIGPPFFAVSATAPLMQHWFSRTRHPHAGDPYFLYGASNLGSVFALLAFPLLLEPTLSARTQGVAWTVGYVILAGLIAVAGYAMIRRRGPDQSLKTEPATANASATAGAPSWRQRAMWLAYSAVPSALLLGVTGHITTDIAAAPMFWVVPLMLYLLSFVIVFARRPILPHALVVRVFPFALVFLVFFFQWKMSAAMMLVLHPVVFFMTALMCHGELARHRPPPAWLTAFYLTISIGGMIGGVFTAIIAPVVFNGVYEYPIALIAACALLPAMKSKLIDGKDLPILGGLVGLLAIAILLTRSAGPELAAAVTAGATILGVIVAFGRKERPLGFALGLGAVLFAGHILVDQDRTLWRGRSFFGVYKVIETEDSQFRLFAHGTTNHGGQRTLADGSIEPVTYYTPESPLVELIRASQDLADTRKVGVVGLGAGSFTCYRRPEETWHLYEIDPLVGQIAEDGRYFRLVPECAPTSPIIIGDARLTLGRERDEYFDFLLLDAFTSDAIPLHLMTREAFSLYMRKLQNDGVLVLNISNRHLDLRPTLARLADDMGLSARMAARIPSTDYDDPNEARFLGTGSMWALLARRPETIERLDLSDRWLPLPKSNGGPPWTDDFSNILEAITFQGLDLSAWQE